MEAIGERPGQFGGNVVVLGRAGAATLPEASGFSDAAAGVPGPVSSSSGADAADDGTWLRRGWPLRAVAAGATPANAEQAGLGQAGPTRADSEPAGLGHTGSTRAESAPPESGGAGQPLNLAEIGRLLAEAAAAAPSMLAGADYVEAANYAGQVEELSRGMEYLQVLSAGTVDRTRTQAIAAADAARTNRSRTGKTWVTGWDNGRDWHRERERDWDWDGGGEPVQGDHLTGR
jgi:hypothetical protein